MNNLHRSLAPISDAAWEQIDETARDAFAIRAAGRRVVDVPDAEGPALGSVDLGHLSAATHEDGVEARLHRTQPLVWVRVPFTVSRQDVDDVERGALDLTWDEVSDAAAKLIDVEDRAILHGWAEAGITGLTGASAHEPVRMPADIVEIDDAVSTACNKLRLADVEGPYDLVLPQRLYTEITETTDHGRPIIDHLEQLLLGGCILWAPAAESPIVVSHRGGDATLYLGRDASIGYLSHDAETVTLYLQESFTVLVHQPDAALALVK
ncbi:MAG: family 1 encapsulin nanocompartment shell protein [Leucobacter sp.]